MVKVQEYLNQNYPVSERGSVKVLDITKEHLEGHLDLKDFVNLKVILSRNQLTSVYLSENIKLEAILLFQNKISANLSIFSHLTNLKKLDLGMEKGYSNDFSGSLKALENLTNLEYLCIGQNKKITEGLEYVPTDKLTHFGCHGTIFEKMLEPYGLGHKGLKAWKEASPDERERIRKNIEIEREKTITKIDNKEELEKAQKELINLSKLLGEKEDIKNQLDLKILEVVENKHEISKLKKKTEAEISKLENQLKDKKAELNQLTTKKDNEISKLTSGKESEINNLKATISQKEQLLIDIKKQKVDLEAKITSLQTEKKALETNLSKKEKDLKAEFSRERETKLTELRNQHKDEQTKLRNKINKKLESGSWFTPSEQGLTLEQSIDNLLEKQAKLENKISELEKEITIVKKALNAETSKKGETLIEASNNFIKEKCRNEKYVPTTGDKFLNVIATPFNWVSNKVGTGLALTGFLTAFPTLFTWFGYLLKSYLKVKTGGVHGAYQVANDMTNYGNHNPNIPSPHQPLPPTNHYLPPQPQPLPETTPNLPPVMNNHYHGLPVEKKTRKVQKKKTT